MSAPTSSSDRLKHLLIAVLKIAVPLALGIWLVVYFYRQLDADQRRDLFIAFTKANWWWLGLSVLLGWCSHLSRAWRWRYLLGHMDHHVSFWNSYNATLSGYFMNMVLPRAGEATRAAMLYRAESVPFEKGFGTILAERAVDMIILLSIAGITLLLQLDRIDVIKDRIKAFRAQGGHAAEATQKSWFPFLLVLLVILIIAGIVLIWKRPAFRARVRAAASGFLSGLRSVLHTRKKGPFIFHTLLIWGLYVAMFWIGFFALEATSTVPFAGVMAGFIAGSVGIVLVQGGIGAYPAFVALIVSVYMTPPEGAGSIRPEALAMGWLLWAAQTLMIIVLGGISLLLISRERSTAQE